jgi:hypothetical protein
MGIDCDFDVHCFKVTHKTHTFTTPTPWKETKEFTQQGYKVIRTSDTEVFLMKEQYLSEPSLSYSNRLSFIEPFQELYQKYIPIYSQWCYWSFNNSEMSGIDHFKTTLQVWDDIWNDIIADAELHNTTATKYNKEYPIGIAEEIRDGMRKILEFASTNEGITVQTSFRIDW